MGMVSMMAPYLMIMEPELFSISTRPWGWLLSKEVLRVVHLMKSSRVSSLNSA